jgi:phage-related protein
MRKKGRTKYFLVIFVCVSIFIYGFFVVNITKVKDVRKKSKFTIDVSFKPIDFRIETKDYVFYVNSKIIDNVKEKYNDIYNGVFSK